MRQTVPEIFFQLFHPVSRRKDIQKDILLFLSHIF